MNPVLERIEKIKTEFANLPDWEARYRVLIKMAQQLSPLDSGARNDDNRIRGCQSQVWLTAAMSPQKRIIFQGDSDAIIVKGLVALVVSIYSDATPSDILATKPDFLKEMGFEASLSPSRANGFAAMIKQIYFYALAFQSRSEHA